MSLAHFLILSFRNNRLLINSWWKDSVDVQMDKNASRYLCSRVQYVGFELWLSDWKTLKCGHLWGRHYSAYRSAQQNAALLNNHQHNRRSSHNGTAALGGVAVWGKERRSVLRPVLGSVTNLGHLLSISGIHCLLLKEKIGLDKKICVCIYIYIHKYIYQFSSVTRLYLTLCNPMDYSMRGLPVHHQLPELAQTHVHRVSDAIQPFHPLSSPSSPIFSLSQHWGLFQWVSSSHQVAKVLEFQL